MDEDLDSNVAPTHQIESMIAVWYFWQTVVQVDTFNSLYFIGVYVLVSCLVYVSVGA